MSSLNNNSQSRVSSKCFWSELSLTLELLKMSFNLGQTARSRSKQQLIQIQGTARNSLYCVRSVSGAFMGLNKLVPLVEFSTY